MMRRKSRVASQREFVYQLWPWRFEKSLQFISENQEESLQNATYKANIEAGRLWIVRHQSWAGGCVILRVEIAARALLVRQVRNWKQKTKIVSFSKKPCWDVPREGLQHETIENEREFVEMTTQQEVFQKKAAIQKKINEKRIDDMQETQMKLREKFIKVNEFMKECSEKTARAESEIISEQEQQEALKTEIAEVEQDLNELSTFESKFNEIIKEFQPYEDVFQEVIKASDTYESFEDLMSRCDALSSYRKQISSIEFAWVISLLLVLAQVEIAEREQELIKGIELIRQKMLKSTHEAAEKIIELNNELAELEVRLTLFLSRVNSILGYPISEATTMLKAKL